MMTLLIILASIFAVVALMVILGERFAKPIKDEEQRKYARILPILVFVVLIGSLIKMLVA